MFAGISSKLSQIYSLNCLVLNYYEFEFSLFLALLLSSAVLTVITICVFLPFLSCYYFSVLLFGSHRLTILRFPHLGLLSGF